MCRCSSTWCTESTSVAGTAGGFQHRGHVWIVTPGARQGLEGAEHVRRGLAKLDASHETALGYGQVEESLLGLGQSAARQGSGGEASQIGFDVVAEHLIDHGARCFLVR